MKEVNEYLGPSFRGKWNGKRRYWFRDLYGNWQQQFPEVSEPWFDENYLYSNDLEEAKEPENYNSVEKPKHYHIKVPVVGTIVDNQAEIDCLAVTESLGFNQHHYIASALAYIWRCLRKNNTVEDLRKAVFYLNREIALREKSNV